MATCPSDGSRHEYPLQSLTLRLCRAIRPAKSLKGGVYTLVAYTQWMRNFPAEQFCYQPLTVVSGQRARGHRIANKVLAHMDAKVTVRGNAATDRNPIKLDFDIHDKEGQPLQGIYALSVTDYDVVKPDSLFGDIRQNLLRQHLSYQVFERRCLYLGGLHPMDAQLPRRTILLPTPHGGGWTT